MMLRGKGRPQMNEHDVHGARNARLVVDGLVLGHRGA